MAKILRLKFNLAPKGFYQVDLNQPKDDITVENVETLMKKIVEEEIFKPKTGEITSIETAYVIEETVTTIL